LERRFGEGVWRSGLERRFGEVVWRGDLERRFGEEVWRGGLEKRFGEWVETFRTWKPGASRSCQLVRSLASQTTTIDIGYATQHKEIRNQARRSMLYEVT
jgi:hypothetical protein